MSVTASKRPSYGYWPPLPRAIELYNAGRSLRQIAGEVKYDSKTVRNWLLKSGVEMRSRGGCNGGAVPDTRPVAV